MQELQKKLPSYSRTTHNKPIVCIVEAPSVAHQEIRNQLESVKVLFFSEKDDLQQLEQTIALIQWRQPEAIGKKVQFFSDATQIKHDFSSFHDGDHVADGENTINILVMHFHSLGVDVPIVQQEFTDEHLQEYPMTNPGVNKQREDHGDCGIC